MTFTEIFLAALLFASVGLNGILWARLENCRMTKLDQLIERMVGRHKVFGDE
jgi:hypothetical protein